MKIYCVCVLAKVKVWFKTSTSKNWFRSISSNPNRLRFIEKSEPNRQLTAQFSQIYKRADHRWAIGRHQRAAASPYQHVIHSVQKYADLIAPSNQKKKCSFWQEPSDGQRWGQPRTYRIFCFCFAIVQLLWKVSVPLESFESKKFFQHKIGGLTFWGGSTYLAGIFLTWRNLTRALFADETLCGERCFERSFLIIFKIILIKNYLFPLHFLRRSALQVS